MALKPQQKYLLNIALNPRKMFVECGFEPAQNICVKYCFEPAKQRLNVALDLRNTFAEYGFEPAKTNC